MRKIASMMLMIGLLLLSGSPLALAATPTAVEQISAQLAARSATFTLSLPDLKQAEAVFKQAMQADDYTGMIVKSYTIRTKGVAGSKKGSATYKVVYLESKAQSDYVTAQAKAIVAKLTTSKMNDFQKEKILHDYIASHVTYDDALRNYSAYEALKTGRAVCQGYALLTYRIMTEAGIPVHIVSGSVSTGLHAWNKVMLGGAWYNVDTTWNSQKTGVEYRYFNVTDAALKRDHSWQANGLPAATTDYRGTLEAKIKAKDKFAIAYQSILNDLGEQAATLDEAINVINDAISDKKATVKFTYVYGKRNLRQDVQAMMDGQEGAKKIAISYSYASGTATIEAKLGY
ncbi:transglutaminase domain-containing protein [Cohnella sp. GCM10027633]|uniref:transglutaminase domain-containing protein n=1 Tax=unclassified Cohnella TaxID=2636738 RepID=UPI00363D1E4A